VSESTLATRINAARKAIGDDGAAQRLIKTIARKGIRFVGGVRELPDGAEKAKPVGGGLSQSISFCRTSDNVAIAMATVGQGPPLVKTANWLNHLEYDWESPIWSPFLQRLAARFKVVRYDARGNGLSDRDVADISQAGFERDLEAVVAAAGIERFTLLALSQGVAAAVAFAARHPERVTRLILYGAYAQGRNRRGSQDDAATAQTMLAMMRQGWGHPDSAFMRAFSSLYLSDASRAHIKWFAEMQRHSTSGEIAARLRVACDDIDVLDMLPAIKVPTLVIHARHDNVAPYEQGRLLAARIPGARLVTLESENHIPVPDDPAWGRLIDEIEAFAAEG
jgi:pimeloyl-ACP methyl ester carboxylesterase